MTEKWFRYASPESVGISSEAVERLIDTMCLNEKDQETHSFMIIRHKKIIAEGYFKPFREEQHVIHSCTKAFTSTAVGFAVDEGYLDIDTPVVNFFPEYVPENPDPRLLRMTVRHLLFMSNGHTGIVFARPYEEITPEGLLERFFNAEFSYEPGEVFKYENTNTYVLSAIVKKAVGMDVIEYLTPRLFEKLNIFPYYATDSNGMFVGYGNMRLTMEEIARFGQFYLDGGVWEGERLISKDWAELIVKKHIQTGTPDKDTDWSQGYAFQLWRGKHNSFRYCGAMGQVCAVYPDYDMILVVHSGHDGVIQNVFDSFYENILTKLSDSLPDDKVAYDSLKARCESLGYPVITSTASPFVKMVSGKTFELTDCGEVVSATTEFTDDVCDIILGLSNGEEFRIQAGLKDYAYTECKNTRVVSMQPKDDAVCAATGYWYSLHEFNVEARMLPTHTKFHLYFKFGKDGLTLNIDYKRAYELGTRKALEPVPKE